MFSLQQNWRTREQTRFCRKLGGKEVAQIMYIHVSKYKNDKRKLKNEMITLKALLVRI
jgi:hypothetical protein